MAAVNSSLFDGASITGTATEALTGGRFGKVSDTAAIRQIAMADAGEDTHGIIGEAAVNGALDVSLFNDGHGYLEVLGNSINIARGDFLKAGTNGVGIKSAADQENYGAVAMEPATADNVVIRVQIIKGERSTA